MFKNLMRERRRAVAVHGLHVLDTPAEQAFDRFVRAAADAFDAPIAALSLIYDDRQWFKAAHGLAMDCIPRSSGFCGFALDRPDVLEVCDARADPRFASLPPVVEAPFARYYIGAPLRLLSGIDVGALCVIDTVPRVPASADQKAYLLALARQAMLALETRGEVWNDVQDAARAGLAGGGTGLA
ncbi:GAF domain-containing protein [Sphingomonas abaci]|uniref:GAF domain-containing protein n=1 Tax=Sphingomonas abaci TaxID=237611 RepID=A0A7W7AF78_9SPHN|nr:GAF domain-containing protein [Sphingomonas abaci]MBB4615940.1 GAF domain-containing protein [Sphingomonas abaci]